MEINIAGKNGNTIPFKDHKFIGCATEIENDISNIMFFANEEDNNIFIELLKKTDEENISMYISETKLYIDLKNTNCYYVFSNIDTAIIKKIHENQKVILWILRKIDNKIESDFNIYYDNVIIL